MLTRHPRRTRRSAEHGQALILALAFIAFFGLTVGAVLGVSDVAGQQHQLTEATAKANLGPEGGAAFGAAEAGRSDVLLTCQPGNKGLLNMTNGYNASYTASQCNPSGSSSSGGYGQNCLLCILNQAAPSSPSTSVYTTNHGGITTTGGDDFINGSIASGSDLTATPAGRHIYVLNGASSVCPLCTPTPRGFGPSPILDPYRSSGLTPLLAPSPVAGMPAGCTSWSVTANSGGCTVILGGTDSLTISPGLYQSLMLSGNASVTLSPGTYVFSGPIINAGKGLIAGTNATLYLTCSNYGSAGNPCPSTGSSSGGYIFLNGKGGVTTTAPPPASGTYSGVAILSDPNLLDPGGAGSCAAGSGCLIDVGGNGASVSITGTTDLRQGGADFHGNGGDTISNGRFIANSLWVHGSGAPGSGLILTGSSGMSTSNCGVYVDDVNASNGAGTGRAVIQSQCGGRQGIIDFNYRQ